ncbi:MAG: hypothetical protein AB1489_13760 [Acidobacteriota bacterium]
MTMQLLWVSLILFSLVLSVRAEQTVTPTADVPEQALAALPQPQQTAINKESKAPNRIKIVLKLAEKCLAEAQLLATNNPKQTLAAIDNYQKLICYANLYLDTLSKNRREQRLLYKSFEIALREQIATLEELEHKMASSYADQLTDVLLYVRRCRIESLNTVFGNPILPLPQPGRRDQF